MRLPRRWLPEAARPGRRCRCGTERSGLWSSTREIDPGHRDFPGQVDVFALAGSDGGVDGGAAPVREVLEQPCGEVAHVIDTRAAVRIEAVVVAEQIALVGVVDVDRIRVRHVDFYSTKRIPCAGLLAHRE